MSKKEKDTKKVEEVKIVKVEGKVDAAKYIADNGFPQVGAFEDKKWLQKFYKQLDMETLEKWVAKLEKEVKPSDSEPIYRMRVCMEILYTHFPKEPAKSKKKSKYSDYTTEKLIEMAIEHDVPVEPTEDMRIMRMRTIMMLRAHKVIE